MVGVYLLFLANFAFLALTLYYFSLLPFWHLSVPQMPRERASTPDFSAIFKEQEALPSEDITKMHLIATVSGSIRMALVDMGGKVQTVRIGSQVGSYRVIDIQRNYLLLGKGQETKTVGFRFEPVKTVALRQEAPSLSSPSESLQAVVSKREIENVTADPGIMFRQIRLVPYVQNGQTRGFLFEWVDPQSIFSRAGIKAGDVLIAINNQEIRSGEDAFRILQALRNETSLKISLLRDGAPVELNLRVE
ncbi:general secretion pathway protein C [Hydrogenobacter thermophilus TK-6]|uniref:General secretion pathway protein C n=1 Tax=Hydrogenobacter thermophilus (strain DSM 6534 / IAM 12695 / TK-6) TaxID=608538 RepID=D3DIT2_HYDTT|nr:PDZ domain-containing protein [Hydrogenobacter thermophilus]ADO45661.1 general secretion pathway protein C [Hydrogenobacter thermophilus TK-6]BAI69734.1 general secretion pathway protein C [Hydrogenobacter thermophilus TK-6]